MLRRETLGKQKSDKMEHVGNSGDFIALMASAA
jgi:hypothetical protein